MDYVDLNVTVFTGFDPEVDGPGSDPAPALAAIGAMFSRLTDSQFQRAVVNVDGGRLQGSAVLSLCLPAPTLAAIGAMFSRLTDSQFQHAVVNVDGGRLQGSAVLSLCLPAPALAAIGAMLSRLTDSQFQRAVVNVDIDSGRLQGSAVLPVPLPLSLSAKVRASHHPKSSNQATRIEIAQAGAEAAAPRLRSRQGRSGPTAAGGRAGLQRHVRTRLAHPIVIWRPGSGAF